MSFVMSTVSSPVQTSSQRAAKRDETRALILEAAIARFAATGFEGATLNAIASEAGLRVPLLLYHFTSKDLLWRAAVTEVYGRYEAAIVDAMPPMEAAHDRAWFRAALRAQVAALVVHPAYMRMLFQEGTQHSDRLRWLVDTHQARVSGMMTALIAEAQANGLFPAMDPVHAKFVLSGAASLAVVLAPEYRMLSADDPQSDEFLDRHIDMLMALFMPA